VSLRRLVWRNIARHPVRSFLVFAFAALSLFVFGFLRSIVTSLDEAVRSASTNRLVVSSAVGLFAELPATYREALLEVPGVESVNRWSWFGGTYRDPKNFFPRMAIDLDVFFRQYPEVVVPEEQKKALLEDRRGCLVGTGLVSKFGFAVGQTVSLEGTLYRHPRGLAWDFLVRAVYTTTTPAFQDKGLWFHWDYLQEVRGADPTYEGVPATCTLFMVGVAPGWSAADVAAAIERRWEGGPVRAHAQTEAAFRAERVAAFGNVPTLLGWIGGAVFLAMLFSVVNAASLAARERAREVGVLKALGFRDGTAARLVLWESVLVVGAGGLVGIAVARATAESWKVVFAGALPNYFVTDATVVLGTAIAVAIGFLGGLVPAARLTRLAPVAVLREDA
jgi:putative ABC transport system permease protein